MNAAELQNYLRCVCSMYSSQDVLREIWPILVRLVERLCELPNDSIKDDLLLVFSESIQDINEFSEEIGTEERELILESIYKLGEIVRLDPDSRFAEIWRGDW